MNIGEVKIVADSSADMEDIEGIPFIQAAMKIITAEREFVDDASLNVGTDLSIRYHTILGENPEDYVFFKVCERIVEVGLQFLFE